MRLKKTIEIRGADCLPYALTPALAALSKGLLYDEVALGKAETLVSGISYEDAEGVRRELARTGLRAELAGRPLLEWAREVVALARDGLTQLQARATDARGSEVLYLEPLEQLLAAGQTPADALLAKLDLSQPLAPQVVQLARL